MKRSFVSVGLLLAVLMLNIIFTQYMVHQYFYEKYQHALLAAIVNVVLFFAALTIYKMDKKQMKEARNHEQ